MLAEMRHFGSWWCLRSGLICTGWIHCAQIPSQRFSWPAPLEHENLRLARPGFRRVASYTAILQPADSHRTGDRPPGGLWHRVRRLVVPSQACQPTADCFGQHSAVLDGLSPIRSLSEP